MLTNDCGCTSFVQSETQTRVLQGVILSMYEINIITHIFFSVNKTDTFGRSHSRMFGYKLHSSLPRGFPWFQATHLQTPVLTRD